MDVFESALEHIFRHEGELADDPEDPGGLTYRGISSRWWPDWPGWPLVLGIRETCERLGLGWRVIEAELAAQGELQDMVRQFYRDLWDNNRLGLLPPAVALVLMDGIVNPGPVVIKRMQAIVGAAPDGKIGPATAAAARKFCAQQGTDWLVVRLCCNRLWYWLTRDGWGRNKIGWARRMVHVAVQAGRVLDAD